MVRKTTHPKGYLFDDTPRGILEALLFAGGGAVILTFAPTLLFALAGVGFVLKAEDRARRKKLKSAFQYVKGRGYVKVRETKNGIELELTKRGLFLATKSKLRRALLTPVEKPKEWDKKWRIILFDIPAGERARRNAFRDLIRRLGAVMLQKSVWIYPFDCSEQVALLKTMFEFTDEELRIVVAESIGEHTSFVKHFNLR